MPMFLLFCTLLNCVDERYQDFDAIFEKKVAECNLVSNSESIYLSFDSGLFWTNGIGFVSKSVELHGNKTWLMHRANVRNERNDNTDENTVQQTTKLNHPERWMMEMRNSSLMMRSFGVDAGLAGTTICLVVGSMVEVIDSELLSNMECSGFVVADWVGSGSSRIVIIGSSHKSSTLNVILPLVGRGYGQLNTNNEEWKGGEERFGDGCVEREEIVGVGLSFDSTHFAVGTGPLFSFVGKSLWSGSENGKIGMVGEISTELRSSCILNVTSSFEIGIRSGSQTGLGVGSCVWERVVGSRISGSTNHDMGTALCGTRLGFNVVCVNSSFSSCVRTSNDEIDMKHENVTEDVIGRTLVESSSGMTSVKFTLCTFNDMTVADSRNRGGAAICLNQSHSSLTVTQCFFHKCTCTYNGGGGAIYVWESRTDRHISISSSSFTECETTGAFALFGGSVTCESNSSISISDCFFEKSRSKNCDGAVSLVYQPLATLSNCAFVSCSAQEESGALGFILISSIDLSFLQFRDCSADGKPESNDMYFESVSIVDSNTIRFCDSTSARPNILFLDDSYTHFDRSYLVRQLQFTPTVEVSVSISGETATVMATASTGVKGTMGILLNGSNVPRVVYIPFGSDSETSTTGTAEVSSGADGVLPPAAKYELRASSVPSVFLSSVHSAHSSLSADGNTTEIVLKGINLGEGSYWMLIRKGDTTLNISLILSDSTTLVGEAPLHPSTASGRLEWSTEYEVEKVMRRPEESVEENVHLTNTISFTTPAELSRICSCSGAVLNKDRTQVTISLDGRALGDSLGSIWVSVGGTFWKSSTMRKISETLCEADFLVASEQSETHLKYNGEYTVCLKPDEASTLLVDSGITVRIPGNPSFTEVKFSFTNSLGTGCIAILSGTDLVVGTEYTVKLNTSHTFTIVVKSSTRAESSEMLIGFEGALAYSADILIISIEPADEESGDVQISSPFTGRTQARPNVNEIFIDIVTGQNDWTCGDLSRPCSTMTVAWTIMQTLGIMHPAFTLLNSTSISSPMTIGSGMLVLIQNGSSLEPSLNIPSSTAESATSALIVVSSAFLNIQNIDIVVGSSQPSFVLISASSSKMILKDGLMTVKSSTDMNHDRLEELCLWTTGLIELFDTELNVTNNQFFNISQGAMRMKGGQLNIQGSIFCDNIPSNSSFPSARRNIACCEGGTVQIGSVKAGDGFQKSSAWISSEGCSIESTEVNADAPLFIPTLSSDSTSKLDKKTKSLTLTIEGTILIPCLLLLEVFEMGKDGTEVNSTQIPLTVDSATSFTETKIVVTLPSSSLKSLDESLEWRGRLVFGENQKSIDSFLIQQNSSGRFSQAVKDNMKWWIPLVIVLACALLALILIVVLLRRRNKNKAEQDQNSGDQQELDQTDDKIDVITKRDIEDCNTCVNTTGQKQLQGLSTLSSHPSQSHQDTNMVIPRVYSCQTDLV
ncbi:hypothetical protein BLNAU_9328 [Blattamonas nauphoetae]|uniref:Uncharacterized protein n=1 Tax=Blattamonas nauphoetae TaxID=2049346 RepID=A0ABQ9XVW9_9EUKA|nr:hypothetical protein BLNAU_9328 [Blattamonas nauphoetae]